MMEDRIYMRNQQGFALISIVISLVILCVFAAFLLPRYLGNQGGKDNTKVEVQNPSGSGVPQVTGAAGSVQDEARNMAGYTALTAAASNVQAAYTKLMISNPSGKAVTNEDVAALLNSGYTVVGDYVVSYSSSGTDKIIATLQPGSKGKFGTQNSKEIPLVR
jgi:hypothetical protein